MLNNKIAFYTLGCKVNAYDTQVLRERLKEAGYTEVNLDEPANYYIINTCTVTHMGDKKARQKIRSIRRKNPESTIIATGCYVRAEKDLNQILPEVDYFLVDIDSVLNFFKITPLSLDEQKITYQDEKTRAFVKIQEGCNQFCSYCIVPYVRGPSRSKNFDKILKEVKKLVEDGYSEIVLTGIHVTSFNSEGKNLIDLIENLSLIKGLKRIRLSSLEPRIITKDFLDRLKKVEPFCPHFHLSLQSGSNSVLEKMNRKYSAEDYLNRVNLIKETFENPAITTDIIVGFPEETEKNFKETKELVKKVGFSKIHIFPYSIRKNTPAEKLKQVRDDIKTKRVKELTKLEKEERNRFLQKQIGTEHEVLFERYSDHENTGYTKNYIRIKVLTDKDLSGQIKRVKIREIDKQEAIAEIID